MGRFGIYRQMSLTHGPIAARPLPEELLKAVVLYHLDYSDCLGGWRGLECHTCSFVLSASAVRLSSIQVCIANDRLPLRLSSISGPLGPDLPGSAIIGCIGINKERSHVRSSLLCGACTPVMR